MVATQPQPCVSPALCQGHADLPEWDDELDCPGSPASDLEAESSGTFIILLAYTYLSSTVDGQMGKKMDSSLTPPRSPLHSSPPIPIVVSHLARPVPFAPFAAKIGILR